MDEAEEPLMGQHTETFKKEKIEEMHQYYKTSLEKSPPGAIFRARTEHAVITAYRSGKVLFQGARPEMELDKWIEGNVTEEKPVPSIQTSYYPPENLFTANHIGSDESGTGDYFGPITACAVYVTAEQIPILKEMGIQDSKAITDTHIHTLAKELVQLDVPYSLMVIHNEKYNALQARGWSQGKMKTMIHHSVIGNVLKKIGDAPYEGILIDQFCNPPIYKKHLASERKTLPDKTYFMTKAEHYSIAVAAGSVIARASFLNEMDRLSEETGYPLLKGASQKVDQLIAKIIREKGKEALQGIAKVHFANTEKAGRYL